MRLGGWQQGTDSRPSFETRVSATQEGRRYALLRMRISFGATFATRTWKFRPKPIQGKRCSMEHLIEMERCWAKPWRFSDVVQPNFFFRRNRNRRLGDRPRIRRRPLADQCGLQAGSTEQIGAGGFQHTAAFTICASGISAIGAPGISAIGAPGVSACGPGIGACSSGISACRSGIGACRPGCQRIHCGCDSRADRPTGDVAASDAAALRNTVGGNRTARGGNGAAELGSRLHGQAAG
jgi:hypothetical protein